MSEGPKVIKFESALELQEKKDKQTVERIKQGIARLKEGKAKYEEWQKAALDQGDTESALLYETEVFENEMLIEEGEMLCDELDFRQVERWQQYFNHMMEVDMHNESAEDLENIDSELEFVSDYLESLLEDVNVVDEERKQKIQELQKRKEKLESERLKYSK